jgi:hypothetical protein
MRPILSHPSYHRLRRFINAPQIIEKIDGWANPAYNKTVTEIKI